MSLMNLGKSSAFISSEIAFPCSLNSVLEIQFDAKFYCKGFQPVVVLPPTLPLPPLNLTAKGHLAMSRDSFGCHNLVTCAVLQASCGWRLWVLLNILQCAQGSPYTMGLVQGHGNYLAQNVSSGKIGKPCARASHFVFFVFQPLFHVSYLFYFAAFWVVSLDLGSSLIVL